MRSRFGSRILVEGGQWSFDPRGEPWAKALLKIAWKLCDFENILTDMWCVHLCWLSGRSRILVRGPSWVLIPEGALSQKKKLLKRDFPLNYLKTAQFWKHLRGKRDRPLGPPGSASVIPARQIWHQFWDELFCTWQTRSDKANPELKLIPRQTVHCLKIKTDGMVLHLPTAD